LSDYLFTLGIDWGYREHALCLLDAASRKRWRRLFPHSAEGLAELRAWLRKLVPDLSTLAAGIERPDHPVVEELLEAGIACYAINPKQIERFRAFLSVSGAKDDPRDAEVVALALNSSIEAFRKLEAPDELAVALREASRRLDTLNHQLLATTSCSPTPTVSGASFSASPLSSFPSVAVLMTPASGSSSSSVRTTVERPSSARPR
jgi:Transposase